MICQPTKEVDGTMSSGLYSDDNIKRKDAVSWAMGAETIKSSMVTAKTTVLR